MTGVGRFSARGPCHAKAGWKVAYEPGLLRVEMLVASAELYCQAMPRSNSSGGRPVMVVGLGLSKWAGQARF